MRILVLATLLTLPFGASKASALEFKHHDKITHASLSAVFTAGGIKTVQAFHPRHKVTAWNRLGVSVFVLGIGHWKEVQDEKDGGKFDQEDMAANLAGVLIGNFLQWEF